MKLRLMLLAERLANALTNWFGLRVILTPQSTLHSEAISFRGDGLICSHTVNFLEDKRFLEVVESIRREITHPVYHLYRVYMAVQLAQLAARVPGSIFVECGVGEGVMSLAINRYLTRVPDTLLVDTFAGIDPALLKSSELRGGTAEERRDSALKSYPTSDFASVSKRFAAYPNVKLVKGSVPQVLQQSAIFDQPVSWLHIDMNSAAPEYAALKFFYERMSVPGFILFDDYGFKGLRSQKDAIDTACAELGIAIPISLPTGQGLIVRTH